jgi:hypothetical protein
LIRNSARWTSPCIFCPSIVTVHSIATSQKPSDLHATVTPGKLPVSFEVVALSGFALLAFAGAALLWFFVPLAILGLGMGIAMPNATAIVQNAVPRTAMGVATTSVAFIRALGAALGVALSAGVMTSHLTQNLGRIGGGIDARALLAGGVDEIRLLSPAAHLAVAEAYRNAIGFSFLIGGMVMTLALILASTLRNTSVPPTGS